MAEGNSLQSIIETLTDYGKLGVQALRQDVEKVSATGKTANSIRFEVSSDSTSANLTFYGREFFKALETGRGPRKSSTYSGFDENMYEYMEARGIGSDLPEKKRRQLARFLAYKINKEGDSVFKKRGRIVYSPTLTKLVSELKRAITHDYKQFLIRQILQR